MIVTDRPRGFGIVARTKFPRRGEKGGGGVAVGRKIKINM